MAPLLETCLWFPIMDNKKSQPLDLVVKTCQELVLIYSASSSILLAVPYALN